MAIVEVDLTVDAITDYQDGKRLWAHESYEVQGEERARYFVVWDDKEEAEYEEGSVIHVRGLLGARTSEPNKQGNVFVQLSINSPDISEGHRPKVSRSAGGRSGSSTRQTGRSRSSAGARQRGDDTPF